MSKYVSDKELIEFLEKEYKEWFEKATSDALIYGAGMIKMGTAKLITQCGSERTAPADLSKNLIVAGITDGSQEIGKRTFQKDKSRDGEYREVYTEYTDAYKKKMGREIKKDYRNAEELVKDLSLQELINLKLKDMKFLKEEVDKTK